MNRHMYSIWLHREVKLADTTAFGALIRVHNMSKLNVRWYTGKLVLL